MKPAHRFASIVLFLIVAAPALVVAAPSDYAPRPDEPLDQWLKRVVYTGIVAGLLYGWTWLKGKKAADKVTKLIDEHKLIQMIADDAMGYAEELGHRAVKAGKKLESEVKESEAVQWGLERLRAAGWNSKKAREDAENEFRKIMRARLGATRKKAG